MRPTLRPVTAIVLGVLIALAGVYLVLQGEGGVRVFGGILAALAVLSALANLWLHYREQGRF